MIWNSLPNFGTAVLCAILVSAGYTFAVSLAAAAGRPRLLQAARSGAYGTIALIGLAVLLLAYAFVSHDFRLRYVVEQSDRTMTTEWLLVALWGGQDGSLLWWLFLTAATSGACIWWLKGRYRQLQPFVIATLSSVMVFLALMMLFATNPFATLVSGAPPDGGGLNYQLRNIYMIIHPPSLYLGFTSCAIPFAFSIAALATGRLDNEWIVATRKWMIFSWIFLSIGNALGMAWAYEELGWGGYWAWDPVENMAFLPWLTASAYVHSVMIQERRGMLKMWNVILICLTFFLTYFGTFWSRSGLIASVHAFAKSGIGGWFAAYMLFILVVCTALFIWRAHKLRSAGRIDSVLSREFAFVLNNWILLIIMLFIAVATCWPFISEHVFDQNVAVKPPFFNAIIPPLALLLIFLMGCAPLLGWRKTSKELFYKSFRFPVGAAVVVGILHLALGGRIGMPAFVHADPAFGGPIGEMLAALQGKLPLVTSTLVAFNIAVVVQEFQRGIAARRLKKKEGFLQALTTLVSKSRRRYGGYIVHVGIAVMFLGFAGKNWESQIEVSMLPGETVSIEEYTLTYTGPGTTVDHEKRVVYATVDVARNGKYVDTIKPAQYIYKASPGQPSSEIARYIAPTNDLYINPGIINANTKAASFRIHVNTLVSLVWIGIVILLCGSLISLWPDPSTQEVGAFAYVRALGSVTTMLMLSLLLALAPSTAHGQQQDMERKGVVEQTPEERALFKQLLCDCGDCPMEPLDTCTCGWAHAARDEIRAELAAGKSADVIIEEYAAEHGSDAVSLRASEGKNVVVWLVPAAVAVGGIFLIVMLSRRWRRNAAIGPQEALVAGPRDEYDDRLDDELKDLE